MNDNVEMDCESYVCGAVDAKSTLKNMRLKCKNNLMIAHLSINSIRNKFDLLKEVVSDTIDISIVSETKLH